LLFAVPVLAQYRLETALPVIPGYPSPSEGLPQYINYLFVFGLGIVGIVALGVMTAGGIQYILAAGNMAKTADAKDQILQALIGMGFLLVSYLLLYTINPDLVNLRNPDITPKEFQSQNAITTGSNLCQCPPADTCINGICVLGTPLGF
jgi:hypothetical protein